MHGPSSPAGGGSQPPPPPPGAWPVQLPHPVATPGAASTSQPQPAYYTSYPAPWQYGAWPYPYNPNVPPGAYPNPYANPPQAPVPAPTLASRPSKRKTPSPSPSPPPGPPLPRNWDGVLRVFLKNAGLTQALRGLEMDMLVINEERERTVVPLALEALQLGLTRLKEDKDYIPPSLEERKLEYVHPANDNEPRSPTSINKSISAFLARNRARNDASNRAEFIQSLEEKRARLAEQGAHLSSDIPSCARTDARTVDRDVQMKYDIARNEDGPLRKTLNVKPTAEEEARPAPKMVFDTSGAYVPTAERHPGVDERLKNVEQHLAVNYVPAPPASLMDRVRHLEDYLMRLEKDYPPWAALHFNQPRRGWPPPPRTTPIVVDPRTTVTHPSSDRSPAPDDPHDTTSMQSHKTSKTDKGKIKQSSLSRAIMEKLEVQKAKDEIDRTM